MKARERQLLDAVIADPDDDDVRLVYADWIEDEGDEARGELIQVQIALARDDGARAMDEAARKRLEAREAELLRVHEGTWAAPLGVPGWRFRRGFVDDITLPVSLFLAEGSRVFAAAPIRHVRFASLATEGLALASSPLLARLSSLDLRGGRVGDRGLVELLASPHLGKLAYLRLSMNALHDGAAVAIAGAKSLGSLRHLDLAWNQLAGVAAVALARSTHLPALETLILDGNHVMGDAGAEAFAKARPPRLVELHLGQTGVGDLGAHALSTATWPDLRLLDLAINRVSPTGRDALRAAFGERVRLGEGVTGRRR